MEITNNIEVALIQSFRDVQSGNKKSSKAADNWEVKVYSVGVNLRADIIFNDK